MLKLILSLVGLLVAWELFWWALGVVPLTPWQLASRMENPSREVIVVDARTRAEYDLFHIPGVDNHPGLLASARGLDDLPRNIPVAVICLSGHRSSIAGYRLKQMGFHRVYNLSGGMIGWAATGHRTTWGGL
jgi:rhodanese-related sulfurtransferase